MRVCRIWVLSMLAGVLAWSATNARAQEYLIPEVHSLTNNAVFTADMTIGNVNTYDGLYLLPFYVILQLPPDNLAAWGVQIYTDNNTPRTFTDPTGVYGGLRGITNPLRNIPLYWQSYDALQDAVGNWGTPRSVTSTVGGLLFTADTAGRTWGLIPDRNDDLVAASWMNPVNLANRTLVSYQGLGPYPRPYRPFGHPPAYLYLGMDLRGQVTAESFQTLIHLDLYNLGVDLSTGGYATPNPFTPTTGQSANFNFFLRDPSAAFSIKVFSLRGRLLRTLTRERYWDGRDENGRIVEGGLYIYQIEAEGKRVSGTVVLIK